MFDQPVDMVDVSLRMSNLMSQERERKKKQTWFGWDVKKCFLLMSIHSLCIINICMHIFIIYIAGL